MVLKVNCDDIKVLDKAQVRAPRYLVAIKKERDLDLLTLWLASRTYMGPVQLSMLHVVAPAWLEHDPQSGLGGARMLSNLELSTMKNLSMLETGATSIREEFPNVEVDYWIKIGDPLIILPELATTIAADAVLVFGAAPDDRPFWERSFAQRLSNKCPSPMECFSGH